MSDERRHWLGRFSAAEAEHVQALAGCTEEEIDFIRGAGCEYAMDFAAWGVEALAAGRFVTVEDAPQPSSPLPFAAIDCGEDGWIVEDAEGVIVVGIVGAGQGNAKDAAYIRDACNTHHPILAHAEMLQRELDGMAVRVAELEGERDELRRQATWVCEREVCGFCCGCLQARDDLGGEDLSDD